MWAHLLIDLVGHMVERDQGELLRPEEGGALAFAKERRLLPDRQLYERLCAEILAGQLETGARLPSTRVLASELGISRNTTALAYEQLQLEGYIESRVGDGTRVARLQPEQQFEVTRNAEDQYTTVTSGPQTAVLARRGQLLVNTPYPGELYANQVSAGTSPFRAGQPDVAYFPYETWARLLARHARQSLQAVSLYQNAQGHFPLREGHSWQPEQDW
jgi:GntR family transcriptional regulator/MocR family aminotransferase